MISPRPEAYGENPEVDREPVPEEDIQQLILDDLLYFYPGPHAMLSAYLDESGTSGDAPAMCVAGLLYERRKIKQLNKEWKNALAQAGIKIFHTTEAAHLRGEFEGRSREFSNGLYQYLVGLIKKYASGGAVVYTIPKKEFDEFREGKWAYSQYTTCAHVCMGLLRDTARRLEHKQVSFQIESGHEKMGELGAFVKEFYQAKMPYYGPCSFHDKKDLQPLQTADVWAYELGKIARDKMGSSGRPMRKSLEVLIEGDPNKRILILGKDRLQHLFDRTFEMLCD
jgi:hypothetical protein